MRLRVCLEVPHAVCVPVNYQYLLTGAVYDLLAASDAGFATFLHDEGYRTEAEGTKRFKFFTFSGLRFRQRRIIGEQLWLEPGPAEWLLSSPIAPFLTHCATGLLAAGALHIGTETLAIRQVETLPAPDFSTGTARFTCLTPLVAAVAEPDGRTRFLRPCEGEAFSKAVHRNLQRKYALLYGGPPSPDAPAFRLTFDPDYLRRDVHGGTKKITYKGIEIIGAFCPFTVSGSSALLQVGYECGFGEKNSGGFGMAEVVANRPDREG